nr:ABC transporter permease [Porphyromonas pogonae]
MKREFRRITSKPIYFFGMIVAPVISLFFLMSIMGNGLPTSLPLAVVDMDNTSTSRALIRNLDAFPQTDVVMHAGSYDEALTAMRKGEIYGIFYIPKNFMSDAVAGKQPKITYYTNNSYLMAGSLLFRDMKVISEMASGKVGLQIGEAKGERKAVTMAKVQPIKVKSDIMGNPWLSYSIYLNSLLIPGILQLLIFQMTAYSIGVEIKERTSREWLRLSRNSLTLGLFGKLTVHTIIYFIVGLFCLSYIYGFSQFPLNSGWLPMIIALFMLILAAEAMGIFFISVLPILRLGVSFGSLVGMLAFSITGFSFPATDMDPPLRAISNLFPLRHYYLIYVDQALNGRAFFYSIIPYSALMLFMILPMLTLKQLKQALLKIKYIP